MPALEVMDRYQSAVLWLLIDTAQDGEEQFGPPNAVQVRWIQKQSKITDAKGNTTILDGKVISNEEIPLRSAMWLGSTSNPIQEFTALQNSEVPGRGIMRVETADYTSDIKNRNTRYEMGLKRYKDAIMPLIPNYAGSNLTYAGSMTLFAGAN